MHLLEHWLGQKAKVGHTEQYCKKRNKKLTTYPWGPPTSGARLLHDRLLKLSGLDLLHDRLSFNELSGSGLQDYIM